MISSLRRIFTIYRGYRLRLIISQLLLMASALCSIAVATLNQHLINAGLLAGNTLVIIQTGIWMGLLAVTGGLAMSATAALAVFFAQGTAYYLRSALFEKVQSFSFGNFDKFRTGNIMVRLNTDVNNVANAVQYMVMLLLYAPFMVIIAFAMAWIRTPSLLWIMIVVIVVVLVTMAIIIPQIFKAYDKRQHKLDDLNNTLQENLAGVRVVKAFVREDLEMERFGERAQAMREPAHSAAFRVALLNPILVFIAQFFIAVAVWSGGLQVINQSGIEIGQVVTFMQYLSLVVTPLALMAVVIPFMLRGDTSAERILEVIDQQPDIKDSPDVRDVSPDEIKGRVVLENVTFAFRREDGGLDPPVLKNINLTIEPGERVGFLGATGAGKTALVNLIPRFYDVTDGRITIDGVDIREYGQDDLRQIVGIALQEAVLFQGDVRFNLKFGNPEGEDSVMQDAARAADAYDFIDGLPQKWDAPVARRGYNFSGGQRQRLSISRTLNSRPKVLILDDSTSALDVATESRVQEAIPEFTDNVTTLYVAQRISAVIDLDRIVLLEHGEIVAEGNHEELLAGNSLYQEIYDSQLGSGVTAGVEVES